MKSRAAVQLFCFPHAGASAAVYARWRRLLPAWIQLQAVELPGRGQRAREPLETTFGGLLDSLDAQVQPEPGLPFAFFGHSLGALLAFELAWRRSASGARAPRVVFAAGTAAPSRRDPARHARLTSEPELLAELQRLGGTPAAVLADPELMALTLPILRADFQVVADYTCPDERRISSTLQVLAGTSDTTTPETLAAWRDHTRGDFFLSMFAGGHFFVQQQLDAVLELIERRLVSALGLSALQPAPTRHTAY